MLPTVGFVIVERKAIEWVKDLSVFLTQTACLIWMVCNYYNYTKLIVIYFLDFLSIM